MSILDDGGTDLGTCCGCGGTTDVHNIVMLNRRGPVPGHGWGCVVCHLPADGAYAVVCDTCMATKAPILIACRGYPSEGRILIAKLPRGLFDHNKAIDHG